MSDYPDIPDIPERAIYTTNFPKLPVDPKILSKDVTNKLQSLNKGKVTTKTGTMVEEMCKTFNKCIELNKNKESSKTLVLSSKTGSAKSLTAKCYIALLQKEKVLVVVPTVEDANGFCEDINNWSGDSNYARCHYTISNDNPQSMYYADKANLANHKCIIITHAMYILINKNQSLKLFEVLKLIDPKLVIIDERISLYNRYSITSKEVNDLIELFTSIDLKTDYDLKDDISKLKEIATVFKNLNDQASSIKKSDLILPIKKQSDISAVKFKNIYEVLEDNIMDLSKYISSLGQSTKNSKQELKTDVKELLRIIKWIGDKNLSFHKSGDYDTILFTSNIEAHFGSTVVLDATATVNEIYNNTTYNKPDKIQHVDTTDPRIYNNLTIYTAKGYPQGRETIYKNQKSSDYKTIANNYLKLANSLMTNVNDKMLIVTFKEFAEVLQKQNRGTTKIVITNWGNHVGKNKWSDCNKVMIVGWLRVPTYEYYGNFIDSMNNVKMAAYSVKDDTRSKFETTQIVDDLVQASMRCSARKIIDEDGNCEKSEVYIFYPHTTEGEKIMKHYAQQFKGAKIIEWNPKGLLDSKKTPKSASNIDTIIDYLKQTLNGTMTQVTNKDIIENTALAKSIVSRTVNDKKFLEKMNIEGFKKVAINKQSKAFVLK